MAGDDGIDDDDARRISLVAMNCLSIGWSVGEVWAMSLAAVFLMRRPIFLLTLCSAIPGRD